MQHSFLSLTDSAFISWSHTDGARAYHIPHTLEEEAHEEAEEEAAQDEAKIKVDWPRWWICLLQSRDLCLRESQHLSNRVLSFKGGHFCQHQQAGVVRQLDWSFSLDSRTTTSRMATLRSVGRPDGSSSYCQKALHRMVIRHLVGQSYNKSSDNRMAIRRIVKQQLVDGTALSDRRTTCSCMSVGQRVFNRRDVIDLFRL
ncbi:hypothetical protein KSP39_PZI010074 [Platanthera zijinensis]|uniref:Uncharacterized protein n=1 Tax=Platanthera zijinensis TaxID=2320716 RepID=A0AAP0G6W8_9ASPA